MELEAFVHKWRDKKWNERQGYQLHFIDLCAVLGVPPPGAAGEESDYYFEYGVTKGSGGNGWADVFRRGCFGWEYKAAGRDLKAALSQLQDHRVSLYNPPLLITCDFQRFEVTTNFQNSEAATYSFGIEELTEHSLAVSRDQEYRRDFTNIQLLRSAFDEAELKRLRVGVDPSGGADTLVCHP